MALSGPVTSAEKRHALRQATLEIRPDFPKPAPEARALAQGIADDPDTLGWTAKLMADVEAFKRRRG